jgi:hypothetical protein
MSTSDSIKILAEVVADGDCVLFLGNDLPLGYSQSTPPCRDELAAELARDLDMPPPWRRPAGLAPRL